LDYQIIMEQSDFRGGFILPVCPTNSQATARPNVKNAASRSWYRRPQRRRRALEHLSDQIGFIFDNRLLAIDDNGLRVRGTICRNRLRTFSWQRRVARY